MREHMEIDATEGCPVGGNPRKMTQAELGAAGHTKTPLLTAIRANCLNCCMGSAAEVRRCGIADCSLWPYRMGTNPFRAETSGAQRAAARRNMARLQAGAAT